MGKIAIREFISLDGVVEDPGGAEDYRHGGWSFKFDRGDAGNQFKLRETMDAQALLLGRTTYEGFAAAWPEREGEFADKFNSMPKYVVTSTLTDPDWTNTTVIDGSGDVVARVEELKRDLEGEIQVPGSVRLAQALLEADLVDELRLMVFPVLLGSGKRLFGAGDEMKTWSLKSVETVGDGVTIQIFEPVR